MKYRFAQPTYVDNVLHDGGPDSKPVEVDKRHVPGPHWEPMDDEARARVKECKVEFTGMVPDSVEAMTKELAASMAAAKTREETHGSPSAIGAAVAAALIEAGLGSKKAAAPAKAPVTADVV